MTKSHALMLRSKKGLATLLSGNHQSLFKGSNGEIMQLREYEEGDEIRSIDWKLSAKMDQLYVKVTQDEKVIPVMIIPLISGSLYFGSHTLKHDMMGEVISILGMSALMAKDPLSILLPRDNKITLTPFSTQQKDFLLSLDTFFSIDPKGKTPPYEEIAKTLMKSLRKKTLLIFIGDFFPPHTWDQTLFRSLSIKHDVVSIMVRDTLEENPTAFDISHFCDPQTFEKKSIVFSDAMSQEASCKLREYDQTLIKEWNKWGIRNSKIMTHQSPLGVLSTLFLRS